MVKSKCPVCKKQFSAYPSWHQTYCSRACMHVAQRGAGHPRWKGETRDCPVCGMTFKPGEKSQRFCSIKCVGLAHRGPNHGNWKGGRVPLRAGYIRIRMPEHPANVCGYVVEHRLVMERHIGRLLEPTEEVHHRDGNRSNNDISNLVLLKSTGDHRRAHATYRTETHKQCTRCLIVKPRSDFSRNAGRGALRRHEDPNQVHCKQCTRQAQRVANPRGHGCPRLSK